MTAAHTSTRELRIATLRASAAIARVAHHRALRVERRLERLRVEALAESLGERPDEWQP